MSSALNTKYSTLYNVDVVRDRILLFKIIYANFNDLVKY